MFVDLAQGRHEEGRNISRGGGAKKPPTLNGNVPVPEHVYVSGHGHVSRSAFPMGVVGLPKDLRASRASIGGAASVTVGGVPVVRSGDFEWDGAKAGANLRKHAVSFDEATEVFDDPHALDQPDPGHSDRFVITGTSYRARLLFVVYAERRGDLIRIISARRATRHERKSYEEER